MIVVRLYGQFHLSGMVCHHTAAVVPADVINGFAEGVNGKHREGGEHRQHDAPASLRGQTVQNSQTDSLDFHLIGSQPKKPNWQYLQIYHKNKLESSFLNSPSQLLFLPPECILSTLMNQYI